MAIEGFNLTTSWTSVQYEDHQTMTTPQHKNFLPSIFKCNFYVNKYFGAKILPPACTRTGLVFSSKIIKLFSPFPDLFSLQRSLGTYLSKRSEKKILINPDKLIHFLCDKERFFLQPTSFLIDSSELISIVLF